MGPQWPHTHPPTCTIVSFIPPSFIHTLTPSFIHPHIPLFVDDRRKKARKARRLTKENTTRGRDL
uniref:Uncharacterized protein n=1 Tax=Physcomitrium patens TaxID=3218 RepID=A0A2K1IIS7_PHYPA|nr:hypothetical protein PHYPA_027867 [Physcomitrium patens]